MRSSDLPKKIRGDGMAATSALMSKKSCENSGKIAALLIKMMEEHHKDMKEMKEKIEGLEEEMRRMRANRAGSARDEDGYEFDEPAKKRKRDHDKDG